MQAYDLLSVSLPSIAEDDLCLWSTDGSTLYPQGSEHKLCNYEKKTVEFRVNDCSRCSDDAHRSLSMRDEELVDLSISHFERCKIDSCESVTDRNFRKSLLLRELPVEVEIFDSLQGHRSVTRIPKMQVAAKNHVVQSVIPSLCLDLCPWLLCFVWSIISLINIYWLRT